MVTLEQLVREGVYNAPLALLSITDSKVQEQINNYLPYSIGIEIECSKSENFRLSNFQQIPNIVEVNIDENEQRFRIPNGLAGLICLFNICEQLAINSELNPESGHHYHIDMTNTYHLLNDNFIQNNEDWILKELDSWEYKGNFNSRRITFNINHNWVRFQNGFKTAEFRIGNMTFDYNVIVTRLIHACKIIQTLNKKLIREENLQFIPVSTLKTQHLSFNNLHNAKLQILINDLTAISTPKVSPQTKQEEIKKLIKSRTIKL